MPAREALEIAELRGWTGLAQVAASYLTLAAVHVEPMTWPRRSGCSTFGWVLIAIPKIMFYALKATRARMFLAGEQLVLSTARWSTAQEGSWILG